MMKIKKTLFILLCMYTGTTLAMFKRASAFLFSKTSEHPSISSDRKYQCFVTPYTSESPKARARMKKAYLDMMNRAQRKLYGAFFMLTDREFLFAAACARARGVDVKFIVDYGTVQSAKKGVEFLKRRKVPVYVYRDISGGMMHCKFLTNGTTTLHGSANGTPCAHAKHVEYVEKNDNDALARHKLNYFECILHEIEKQKKEARHLNTKSARDWRNLKTAYKERVQDFDKAYNK